MNGALGPISWLWWLCDNLLSCKLVTWALFCMLYFYRKVFKSISVLWLRITFLYFPFSHKIVICYFYIICKLPSSYLEQGRVLKNKNTLKVFFSFFLFKNIWFVLVLLHSSLMHCSVTESPDPEFQLLPLTSCVTLDKLLSLSEPKLKIIFFTVLIVNIKIIIQKLYTWFSTCCIKSLIKA